MDIFEPIRQMLLNMIEADKPTNDLKKQCGIKSSCYPPSEFYPDGNRIEYPFPINPKDTERYAKL